MSIVIGYDVIHASLTRVPGGVQLCGYTTGSANIAWTTADWTAHPGSVRICQDAGATDRTADVLDVEQGAATIADVPGWAAAALASYKAGTRPGQRYPLVYCQMAAVTPIANGLTAARLASGEIGLWIADWNNNMLADILKVASASGPFPVHGWQVSSLTYYDVNVFSADWLNAVAG